jgi:hypothetical protein
MISLLPIATVIRYVAALYALTVLVVVFIVWQLGGEARSLWSTLLTATSGAAALQLALMFWFYMGWRRVWHRFPQLNRLLFPDINGEWRMEIHWQGKGKSGCITDAKATVKLNFLRASMEVISHGSQSQTLIAQPKKDPESGAPYLYYVYLVQPKAIGLQPDSPYHGAAILKFSEVSGELSGNYWTSAQTSGHFRLSRDS